MSYPANHFVALWFRINDWRQFSHLTRHNGVRRGRGGAQQLPQTPESMLHFWELMLIWRHKGKPASREPTQGLTDVTSHCTAVLLWVNNNHVVCSNRNWWQPEAMRETNSCCDISKACSRRTKIGKYAHLPIIPTQALLFISEVHCSVILRMIPHFVLDDWDIEIAYRNLRDSMIERDESQIKG